MGKALSKTKFIMTEKKMQLKELDKFGPKWSWWIMHVEEKLANWCKLQEDLDYWWLLKPVDESELP